MSSSSPNSNPLSFLGLRRVRNDGGGSGENGTTSDKSDGMGGDGSGGDYPWSSCSSPQPRKPPEGAASTMVLNRRGTPARKRKKNSLIYGTDDLVSIPVRSPRKRREESKSGKSATTTTATPPRRQPSPVKIVVPPIKKKSQALRRSGHTKTAAAVVANDVHVSGASSGSSKTSKGWRASSSRLPRKVRGRESEEDKIYFDDDDEDDEDEDEDEDDDDEEGDGEDGYVDVEGYDVSVDDDEDDEALGSAVDEILGEKGFAFPLEAVPFHPSTPAKVAAAVFAASESASSSTPKKRTRNAQPKANVSNRRTTTPSSSPAKNSKRTTGPSSTMQPAKRSPGKKLLALPSSPSSSSVALLSSPVRTTAVNPGPSKAAQGSPSLMAGMMMSSAAAAAAASGLDDHGQDADEATVDKVHAQELGMVLKNLLKLPKAHRWVCYEFFYSNLDKLLFKGENDFNLCLKDSFPGLKTRRLTRVEWCKIRRLMGKPRRCSAAFFAEERSELFRKRAKIRLLQQRKQNEIADFKDLPEQIPLQLTIGTKVTARLRQPQDGLFTGTVEAYDTSNNTYRIRFDREALGGTHSVRDEEVLSVEEPEMIPLSTFTQKAARPRHYIPVNCNNSIIVSPLRPISVGPQYSSNYSPQLANDPLLCGGTPKGKVMRIDGQVGGYPIKFLEQIVRLSKSLKQKREKIGQLRDLNSQAERRKSFGEYITEDFQRRYASTIIDLSNINRDLKEHIKNIQDFTQEFTPEVRPTISLPNIIREGCQEDAYDLVNKSNSVGEYNVDSPKVLSLISSLTSLMLHIKQLSDGERNSYELQAMQDSVAEVKGCLHPQNVDRFENNVEVHLKHIQSGLSQLGNLHAFMKSFPSQQQQQQPHSPDTAATGKSAKGHHNQQQQQQSANKHLRLFGDDGDGCRTAVSSPAALQHAPSESMSLDSDDHASIFDEDSSTFMNDVSSVSSNN